MNPDQLIQNPARESDDVLKIQQERERRYSKSSKRERGVIQNPARERLENDDGGKRRDEEEEEEEEWAEFGAT